MRQNQKTVGKVRACVLAAVGVLLVLAAYLLSLR